MEADEREEEGEGKADEERTGRGAREVKHKKRHKEEAPTQRRKHQEQIEKLKKL